MSNTKHLGPLRCPGCKRHDVLPHIWKKTGVCNCGLEIHRTPATPPIFGVTSRLAVLLLLIGPFAILGLMAAQETPLLQYLLPIPPLIILLHLVVNRFSNKWKLAHWSRVKVK